MVGRGGDIELGEVRCAGRWLMWVERSDVDWDDGACYNENVPSGGMIFLNNHVLGISWRYARGCTHKILPTL